MKEVEAIAQALSGGSGRAVLATLVTAEGSSYRRPGARLLVAGDGTRIGSISGGCLEDDVLARAQVVARTGRPEVVVYDTTSENDLVWGVGLGCHGVVRVLIEALGAGPGWAATLADNLRNHLPTELAVVWETKDGSALGTRLAGPEARQARSGIFLEKVLPPPRLVIFGAGDDARPLARLAKEFGWRVTVADTRPAYAAAERFPQADTLVCGPAETLVAKVGPKMDSLAVVMTHHYLHDRPILRDLLVLPLAYLGLLGPRKRAEKILADLASAGLGAAKSPPAALRTPVGLDLGGDSPETVALSIIAEMHAVLSGRDGRPLRERKGSIHA